MYSPDWKKSLISRRNPTARLWVANSPYSYAAPTAAAQPHPPPSSFQNTGDPHPDPRGSQKSAHPPTPRTPPPPRSAPPTPSASHPSADRSHTTQSGSPADPSAPARPPSLPTHSSAASHTNDPS